MKNLTGLLQFLNFMADRQFYVILYRLLQLNYFDFNLVVLFLRCSCIKIAFKNFVLIIILVQLMAFLCVSLVVRWAGTYFDNCFKSNRFP